MINLQKIKTLQPQFKHNQREIIDFMQEFYGFDETELRKVKWVYRKSGIDFRYSVLPDFDKSKTPVLFKGNTKEIGISERLDLYNSEALKLAKGLINLYEKTEIEKVTHLITVSCTGISAPGLELQLLKELNANVSQRAINFMGCYAAIHAIKQAQEISALHVNAQVLIVDIELCTLHFQYNTKPDLVNSAMIFADGAAAWLIGQGNGLEVLGCFNKVLHNDADKMAWFPTETGFLMQLSSYIPEIIGNNIKTLINDALNYYKVSEADKISWCIHPGGLKILDKIAESMEIEKDEMASSYEILAEYGNMSSPTVMYVLERMVSKNRIPKGNKVLLVAFGPGLSIETCLLQA